MDYSRRHGGRLLTLSGSRAFHASPDRVSSQAQQDLSPFATLMNEMIVYQVRIASFFSPID
jgi:hypothetical protein